MAATLIPLARNWLPAGRPEVIGSLAGYEYRIRSSSEGPWLKVARGTERLRAPLLWAVGSGRTGQTFLFRLNGELHESRVSLYAGNQQLDWTTGASDVRPEGIADAAGRLMSTADIRECFGCHSSAPSGGGPGSPEALIPGISCERCHGDASEHLAGVRTGSAGRGKMRNFQTATSEEISEACGECHRTWERVMLMGIRGVNTVRFQPYRLTNSKCYNSSDRRISCIACHDPHRPEQLNADRVDAACRACHSSGRKKCPRAAAGCGSCHMPKYEVPGTHARFSDHQIRIVRAGERIPD